MARMTAADAAVAIMKTEGVTHAFGVPGAAINPLYAALRRNNDAGGDRIDHVLARHVEGAAHMAEGYTRTRAGNIGVCIGTSGPAGTDMITGLYSASADSIPILCITGQAPVARLHKEDFQAVDIAAIAKPLTKMAVTVLEAAQVPGVFQQAFHLMRSGRPGPVLIDLPFDVQMTEIEFDVDTYAPLPAYKPAATRAQVEKALDMLQESAAPIIVAGGGIINADASDLLVELAETLGVPVVPTLMGWGAIPDDHRLMAGMAGLQTSQQLRQRHPAGLGLRVRHRQPLGQPAHRRPGRLPARPEVRARRHRADPDRPGVRAGLRHRLRRRRGAGAAGRGGQGAPGRRPAARLLVVGRGVRQAQGHHAAPHPLRRRAGQAAAGLRGDEPGLRPGHPLRVHDRAVADRRRPVPARLPAPALDQRRAGRPAGLDAAGRARGLRGRPGRLGGRAVAATTTSSSCSRSWPSARSSTCPTSTSW